MELDAQIRIRWQSILKNRSMDIIIIIIITTTTTISFMQGINTFVPENKVSREYSVAAVLLLLLMVQIRYAVSSVSSITLLH